jgi:hypothetical protein
MPAVRDGASAGVPLLSAAAIAWPRAGRPLYGRCLPAATADWVAFPDRNGERRADLAPRPAREKIERPKPRAGIRTLCATAPAPAGGASPPPPASAAAPRRPLPAGVNADSARCGAAAAAVSRLALLLIRVDDYRDTRVEEVLRPLFRQPQPATTKSRTRQSARWQRIRSSSGRSQKHRVACFSCPRKDPRAVRCVCLIALTIARLICARQARRKTAAHRDGCGLPR